MKLKKLLFIFFAFFPSVVFAAGNAFCQDPNVIRVFNFLYHIIYFIKVLVPVLLILLGGYTLFKTIIYNKDLNVALRSIFIRFIFAVAIFFVPTFFSIILKEDIAI